MRCPSHLIGPHEERYTYRLQLPALNSTCISVFFFPLPTAVPFSNRFAINVSFTYTLPDPSSGCQGHADTGRVRKLSTFPFFSVFLKILLPLTFSFIFSLIRKHSRSMAGSVAPDAPLTHCPAPPTVLFPPHSVVFLGLHSREPPLPHHCCLGIAL